MYFCLWVQLSCLITPPLISVYPHTLPQLQLATQRLATQAFRPGTTKSHLQQASTYTNFCDHYRFPFINPSLSTITCYITYRTQNFQSTCSIYNYMYGVRFLHKEVGLARDSLDSFPVTALLRAADITMRVHPCRHLPILPTLLLQLCQLTFSLGALGPSMLVALTFDSFVCCTKAMWLHLPPPSSTSPGKPVVEMSSRLPGPSHHRPMNENTSDHGHFTTPTHSSSSWPSCCSSGCFSSSRCFISFDHP